MEEEINDNDMDPVGPGPAPRYTPAELLRRGITRDDWVAEAFTDVYAQLDRLSAVKRDRKQPKVWLQTPTDVLKAFELGVIGKPEARRIMGLRGVPVKRPQPPALARAAAARRTATTRRRTS